MPHAIHLAALVPSVRLAILFVTYLLIAAQGLPWLRLTRPAASLLGAVAMVTVGGLALPEAYAAIDMNVIVFLLGVLLFTAYLELGGFFEWIASRIVTYAHAPVSLLAVVVVVSGLLSAFFVNDTICLVLPPLVLAVVRALDLDPLAYLLAIALGSNVAQARLVCRGDATSAMCVAPRGCSNRHAFTASSCVVRTESTVNIGNGRATSARSRA